MKFPLALKLPFSALTLLNSHRLKKSKLKMAGTKGFESYNMVHSKFPKHQCFYSLCEVELQCCHELLNLAFLIDAPSLHSLRIVFCCSLKEVIEDEAIGDSDIKQDLGVFSGRTTLP